MKIQYNVQPPPKKAAFGGAKCEEVKAIEDFLTSGNAKICVSSMTAPRKPKAKLLLLLPTASAGWQKIPVKDMTHTGWGRQFTLSGKGNESEPGEAVCPPTESP